MKVACEVSVHKDDYPLRKEGTELFNYLTNDRPFKANQRVDPGTYLGLKRNSGSAQLLAPTTGFLIVNNNKEAFINVDVTTSHREVI